MPETATPTVRLFRVQLAKRPRAIARDVVNAASAHRAAGTSPIDDVAEILDEAVVFSGAVGELVEAHLDRAVFRMVAATAVQIVNVTLDRGAEVRAPAPVPGM